MEGVKGDGRGFEGGMVGGGGVTGAGGGGIMGVEG